MDAALGRRKSWMSALRHHVLASESPWPIALKSIYVIHCLKTDFKACRAEP
jgi:hypothetical protein